MKRILVSTAVSLAIGTILIACGSSNDNKAKPGAGTGGGTSGGGSNGGGSNGGGSNGGGSNGGATNGGATNGGATNGGAANGGTANGGATGGCDTAPCTGLVIFGQTPAACCVDATTCGIQAPAQFGGACTPKSAIQQFLGDGGGLTEKIQLDPTCPDLPLPDGGAGFGFDAGSGNSLKGCCDKTSVCGYAFQLKAQGLTIAQCFTPADLAASGAGPVDAGPSKACTFK